VTKILCFINCSIVCYQKKFGKSFSVLSTDGGVQFTSTEGKKDSRQPSSKRRKVNHKRKQKSVTVIDKSRDVLAADKNGAESSDSEVEGKSESSGLLDKMSAWNGLGLPSSILRALAEQGFMEPTEIQVRFRNQSKILAVKHD
jgi:hypothetical protein